MPKEKKIQSKPSGGRIGSDGLPQKYVGVWIEQQDYTALEYLARRNNRSLAGEIRNRILGPSQPSDPINQVGDTAESTLKK